MLKVCGALFLTGLLLWMGTLSTAGLLHDTGALFRYGLPASLRRAAHDWVS